MITTSSPHPEIASQEDWLAKRKQLLEHEKAATREMDRVSAERRRLPMVRIEKDYQFDSPAGVKSLLDLFEGRKQLIVYHFMFDPEWETGCMGCTGLVDALGDISMLAERNTTYALVSRAPLAKLEAYRKVRGWSIPWYSSFGSDFNYDLDVTHDERVAPIQYNYEGKEALLKRRGADADLKGEDHGLSVFFALDDKVFHTYSSYARGCEGLTDSYRLLDVTPYGRQEDWEDSPTGWPQRPTYG